MAELVRNWHIGRRQIAKSYKKINAEGKMKRCILTTGFML